MFRSSKVTHHTHVPMVAHPNACADRREIDLIGNKTITMGRMNIPCQSEPDSARIAIINRA